MPRVIHESLQSTSRIRRASSSGERPSWWITNPSSNPADYIDAMRAGWGYYEPPPVSEPEPPGEIPITLRDEDPFPPTVAVITKGFGGRERMFEEGFKVEIIGVFDDPTKEDRRSIVIRVIDERASAKAFGAVACVSSHRLKLVL